MKLLKQAIIYSLAASLILSACKKDEVIPTSAPTITSFDPMIGPVGTTVTIVGTNFSPITDNNIVKFNGAMAIVTSSKATSIKTSVPVGATSGIISISVNGLVGISSTSFSVISYPAITLFTPASGPIGMTVVITGANFDPVPSNNSVKFNGASATVTASTTTSITTTVPAGATSGIISISVNGQVGLSPTSFSVIPPPTITCFTPTSGPVGITVVIMGTNFDVSPANNIVKFNSTLAIVTASTATSITTIVPSGVSSGMIAITVGSQTGISLTNFTVIPPPTITGFTPTSGQIGAIVQITGTNFDLIPSLNIIKFNGTTATVISSASGNITATVPLGATSGTITVTIANQTGTSLSAFLVLEMKDAEGNSYNTVKIGTQEWMSENLRTTKYANGDPIVNTVGLTEWSALSTGAWSHYNNNPAFNASYGKLYNWYAVTDSRKLCPAGWHVPNESDWTKLTDYLGGESVSGGKMKVIGTQYWNSPNAYATNESGFTALAGGYRAYDVDFSHMGISGYWWSSTEVDMNNGWVHGAVFDAANLFSYSNGIKTDGFSVRCVKD